MEICGFLQSGIELTRWLLRPNRLLTGYLVWMAILVNASLFPVWMVLLLYVLLTTKPGGGKPGFYRGTWEQFRAAANPQDKVLPATGFSYRKPESVEKAHQEWKDWGWDEEPPEFSL